MAKMKYFFGSMGSGKSTLALQMDYNFKAVGKHGILITMGDRSGKSVISSRLGISSPALIINDQVNLFNLVESIKTDQTEYIICDEVQFYSAEQIQQLGMVADNLEIDVFCFGIATDFKSNLFDSSKRLFEIADEKKEIEVKSLCWCGKKGIMHARTCEGYMVSEGEQKIIGDTQDTFFGYEVLCRKHFFERMTKRRSAETEKIIKDPFGPQTFFD